MKFLFTNSVVILLIFVQPLMGQIKYLKNSDNSSDFLVLKTKINQLSEDSLKLQIVMLSLYNAKSQMDTIGMANAYYFLSKLNAPNQLKYADSIISITKNIKHIRYPGSGYLLKGNIYYELGNYKKALDFYLEASKYAKENGNEFLFWTLKFNIGLLKNTIDERKEAQSIFINYLKFLKHNNARYKHSKNYSRGLFALADSYIQSKQFDSATGYITEGIQQTLKNKDTSSYSYFVTTSGIQHFFLKRYHYAIDSLKKGKSLMQKSENVKTRTATCNYYIARSYFALGEIDKSILYFKSVDSIFKETRDVVPLLLDSYSYLIDYYRSKKDIDKQFQYINTLLRLDSINHTNQIYLSKNISKKYDTHELISEKEKLINQLKQDKFLKHEMIIILILFIILLFALAIYGLRKSYLNKKRFQKLLEQHKNKDSDSNLYVTDIISFSKKKENTDIPFEIVEYVLKQLNSFENSNKFSKKYYTLNSLAKELNTNSAYLSKIINDYKHVNFSNYLNNLRIDFAVDQLTKNRSLRFFTIEAIAKEVGFKSRQSFSAAFYKKTGIYPSYFIKRIQD